MLGKSYAVWARIKLPNGGAVYGLAVRPKQSRRIKRARETAALRRTMKIENDPV
jgi:hypothetical protein